MHIWRRLAFLLAVWTNSIGSTLAAQNGHQDDLVRTSLRSISTITLHEGLFTAGSYPIPQLTCAGGSAQGLYQISEMNCTNIAGKGDFGSGELNWRCTATLPEEFRLGSTDVSCEAWRDAETGKKVENGDIVKGSCGVQYVLMLTEAGEARFPNHAGNGNEHTPATNYLFLTVFVSMASYIVYSIVSNCTRTRSADNRSRRPRNEPRSDHGPQDSDDDDDNDHPPRDGGCTSSEANGTRSWVPMRPFQSAPGRIISTRSASRSVDTTDPRSSSSSSFTSSISHSNTNFGGTSHR